MSVYQEYPKEMHHPQHRPAEFKQEPGFTAAGGAKLDGGTYDEKPAWLPPLTVHTKEQEAQAAAKGYVPNGVSDADAYRRGILGIEEVPPNEFQEFPKWKYHAVEEPVLVQNAAEEKKLGAGWANNQDAANALADGGEEQEEQQRAPRKPRTTGGSRRARATA